MIQKITSKRQVTLPAYVLDALGVVPGDTLQLIPGPDGYLLRQGASTTRFWAHCEESSRRAGRSTLDLPSFPIQNTFS